MRVIVHNHYSKSQTHHTVGFNVIILNFSHTRHKFKQNRTLNNPKIVIKLTQIATISAVQET
ncbi:hypothetical protein HanPI659440_Chr13g0521791 [Helianthus annuus]|nr:hypothetical protein HanPI659440_Chr13g0521791 [Helianthus annuus]